MNISIVDLQPQYKEAFKELNYEWIGKFFEVEESDRLILDDPDEHIINKGGVVLIALLDGKAVGTCALIKMPEDVYELAKMAVSPKAQGNQIGYKLGLAIIERARSLDAKSVFLQTNSSLLPAISLYKKLGFHDTCGHQSDYSRCNVQMELKL